MGNSCSKVNKSDKKKPQEKSPPTSITKEHDANIEHIPNEQVANPLVPPPVTFKNTPLQPGRTSQSKKELRFIEKDNAAQIIAEATQIESISSESATPDTCDAIMEIWVDTWGSSTSLHSFHGNTKWLFPEEPLIIPIEDLLPFAIQTKHMLWIKTLLLSKGNARGNWHSLSQMLSRPVLIYNPALKCKEQISVKMQFLHINGINSKAIFSVTLTRLDPAFLATDQLALSFSEKKMTLFPDLLKEDRFYSSSETLKKRKMISVKVMPDSFSNPSNVPLQNELGFAKSILAEARDGVYLPAHCRGKKLCYAISNERNHRIFLTHNYFKIGNGIYYEEGDFENSFPNNSNTKRLVNIETKNILFIEFYNSFNLQLLNEFKHPLLRSFGTDFFECVADGIPFSASELSGRNDVVYNVSHASTLLLIAESFEKVFKEIPLDFPIDEKEQFIVYDMDLNDFANNPDVVSDQLLKNLPLSILRLLIDLHDGKLSKTRKKYVYDSIQPEDILLKLSPDKIELQFRDFRSCREVGSRYSSGKCDKQTFFSPELLYYLEKNNVVIESDLRDRIKGFFEAVEPDDLRLFSDFFFYSAESHAFTAGLVLTSIINKIFTAPHLQDYKKDMLKITSLLLRHDLRVRASLSTVLAVYRYLYETSENSSRNEEHKVIYGNLTAALIKLADFNPNKPDFYEFHLYIQKELHIAVAADRKLNIVCVTKLIDLFCYIEASLAQQFPTN
ncbi:MAG: hypothetical protein NTU49_02610 [Gammaproteobacteria bacterium]|nr:hypothetical protein [Gammaproteobacteria bacterium]